MNLSEFQSKVSAKKALGQALPRIAAVGDSITSGQVLKSDGSMVKYESWVAKVNNITGLSIVNISEQGTCVHEFMSKFGQKVIDVNPQYLIISGGINDVIRVGESGEQCFNDHIPLVQWCWNNNVKPIIGLTIPANSVAFPQEAEMVKLRDKLKLTCNDFGVHYIDFYTPFLKDGQPNPAYVCNEDHCHPNDLGQQVLANAAVNKLINVVQL